MDHIRNDCIRKKLDIEHGTSSTIEQYQLNWIFDRNMFRINARYQVKRICKARVRPRRDKGRPQETRDGVNK